MTERIPSPEETRPPERNELDPWVEAGAQFAEEEVAVLVDAAARRIKERENDPAAWRRAAAKVKRNALATVLALTTVAGAEGLIPKPSEAGHKGRTAARIGAQILAETNYALGERAIADIQDIEYLKDVWRQQESEKQRLVEYYVQLAKRIARANVDIELLEKDKDVSAVREAMEFRSGLREEQLGIREQLARADALQRQIERSVPALQKGVNNMRIGGAITGAGARVLDILSNRY